MEKDTRHHRSTCMDVARLALIKKGRIFFNSGLRQRGQHKTIFTTPDGGICIVCLVSKKYWCPKKYGYTEETRGTLYCHHYDEMTRAAQSWVALGCYTTGHVHLIPWCVIHKQWNELYEYTNDANGRQIYLRLPVNGSESLIKLWGWENYINVSDYLLSQSMRDYKDNDVGIMTIICATPMAFFRMAWRKMRTKRQAR